MGRGGFRLEDAMQVAAADESRDLAEQSARGDKWTGSPSSSSPATALPA
jgi:hypothetical protein